MRARTLLLSAAVAAIAGVALAWVALDPGPVTEAEARAFLDRIVAAARAHDFEKLCALNRAKGNCYRTLQLSCAESLGSGPAPQFPRGRDLEEACRKAVPPEAPTVVRARYSNEPGKAAGQVLTVTGFDGLGRRYTNEVVIIRAGSGLRSTGLAAINVVYW